MGAIESFIHSSGKIRAVSLVVLIALFGLGMSQPAQGLSPKRIYASPNSGIKKIGGKNLGNRFLTLNRAKRVIGKPRRVNRDCEANYGGGLSLLFVSFGGETSCGKLSLQAGTIRGKRWKVFVGKKKYRAGQSRKRIPNGARRFPGFGYQIASMRFIGGRTGTVYAKVRGKRIRGFSLFFGGAGD